MLSEILSEALVTVGKRLHRVKLERPDPQVAMLSVTHGEKGWEYSVRGGAKGAEHVHRDKDRGRAREKLRYMMRNSMNIRDAEGLLKKLDASMADEMREWAGGTEGGLAEAGGSSGWNEFGDQVMYRGKKWMIDNVSGRGDSKRYDLRRTIIVDPKRRHKDEAETKRNVPAREVTKVAGVGAVEVAG